MTLPLKSQTTSGEYLYNLHSEEDIAGHIAYNLIVNKISLSRMDGWADMDDELAKIIEEPESWIETARRIPDEEDLRGLLEEA